MKVFIDLGAYNGDTIELAKKLFDDIDVFYGFEPCSSHFDALKDKFSGEENIILIKAAADEVSKSKNELYFRVDKDNGHSLIKEKINCSTMQFEIVNSINFSNFLRKNFNGSDEIILKINIEGMEYKILKSLIKRGTIKYINKIYCAWHYHKIGLSKKKHDLLVRQLQNLGFDVTGEDKYDNFLMVMNPLPAKLNS